MSNQTTRERITKVIRRSLSDRPDIRGIDTLQDSDPLDALGLDSLTVLDLVYDLQQEFECDGDPRDLAGLQTIGDLAAYLEAREGTASA